MRSMNYIHTRRQPDKADGTDSYIFFFYVHSKNMMKDEYKKENELIK